MDKIEKQLRSIPEKDRERIFLVLEQLLQRNFSALDRKKLKGFESIFRVRIGNYRIIYFDDGKSIFLKAIRRRNEATYHDF